MIPSPLTLIFSAVLGSHGFLKLQRSCVGKCFKCLIKTCSRVVIVMLTTVELVVFHIVTAFIVLISCMNNMSHCGNEHILEMKLEFLRKA